MFRNQELLNLINYDTMLWSPSMGKKASPETIMGNKIVRIGWVSGYSCSGPACLCLVSDVLRF